MTPAEFQAKWRRVELTERSACQQHFLDLCALVGHPTPAADDPEGEHFTFERGVTKRGGGQGWADVWKQDYFAFEYKGKHKDLDAAYEQLLQYREALNNPPLLVVCDLDKLIIRTNFTATATQTFTIPLAQLHTPRNLEILRYLFTAPDKLRPVVTSPALTEEAAALFGELAFTLRQRGHDPLAVAHYLDRLVFCLFVEDIDLLPLRKGPDSSQPILTAILRNIRHRPADCAKCIRELFAVMAEGGIYAYDEILRFNGDLFRDSAVLELTKDELEKVWKAAQLDWAKIEPSIFGTLFERGMDPGKRSQLGAHYTSSADIETLVEPVAMAPLRREWAALSTRLQADIDAAAKATGSAAAQRGAQEKARKAGTLEVTGFLRRVRAYTVLDPACGSGNFLYVTLRKLKDLEREVIEFCLARDIPADTLPLVSPKQMYGLEINPYAFALAQLVVWIGHLQWMHAYGYGITEPVLQSIQDNFHCQDAILDLTDPANPREPQWPKVDCIVGNPPFLGSKMQRNVLADSYVEALQQLWRDRVPAEADLCCYWFERARTEIAAGRCQRAGLLATQGIRGGASRAVLARLKDGGDIFFAVSDRPWLLDGANVHISMVGFDAGHETEKVLDGQVVDTINPNLGADTDITQAKPLAANANRAFMGTTKQGDFDVPFAQVQPWLTAPNAHGRPNSDILCPWRNGRDLTGRPRDIWIIDTDRLPYERVLGYADPFAHIETHVHAERTEEKARPWHRPEWWQLYAGRPQMREATRPLTRYLATPTVSKHRLFVWYEWPVTPDHQLIVFARDDDYFFGVLHSRWHEVWARAQGTQVRERESGFRYTPTTCFETFPFPWAPGTEPLDDPRVQAIAFAARELEKLRSRWLNPPEWTREEVLEFPGAVDGPWARFVQQPDAQGIGTVRYPRLVPRDAACAAQLKDRTLTALYNARPAWLAHAHARLDSAVAAAYGLPAELPDGGILAALLARNLAAAGARSERSTGGTPS